MCCLYNTSNLIHLLSFAQKKVTKKICSIFKLFRYVMPDVDYGACATTSAALRLRRSFCSGLYEAFKGGFAARLIASVLRGCDTKSFVSLTSLSLVHRPAAFAGYPPLPRAVERFLNFLILLIFLLIINIISCYI